MQDGILIEPKRKLLPYSTRIVAKIDYSFNFIVYISLFTFRACFFLIIITIFYDYLPFPMQIHHRMTKRNKKKCPALPQICGTKINFHQFQNNFSKFPPNRVLFFAKMVLRVVATSTK